MGRMDSAGHFAMIPHLRTLNGFSCGCSLFLFSLFDVGLQSLVLSIG